MCGTLETVSTQRIQLPRPRVLEFQAKDDFSAIAITLVPQSDFSNVSAVGSGLHGHIYILFGQLLLSSCVERGWECSKSCLGG